MGTVEQDLARYEREQGQADYETAELERATDAIREEIIASADALETVLAEATENGDFPILPIAELIAQSRAAKTAEEMSSISSRALADIYVAIDPYVTREAAKRAPQRIRQQKHEADEARAEAILDSRQAYLYGTP